MKYNNKFRLPTKEEFERLAKCWSRFDEKKNGRYFFDDETGEKLFLPCKGYLINKDMIVSESMGFYWTSTKSLSHHAYYLCFNSRYLNPVTSINRYYEQSVRLVSDAPFGDAIHVAGLYWKPENEEGFCTFDEAISKFENK